MQHSPYQPRPPFSRINFATLPTPLRDHTSKEPPAIAPRSCISTDSPDSAAAIVVYASGKVWPAISAPRPSPHTGLKPAETAPRHYVSESLLPTAAVFQSEVPEGLPPAAVGPPSNVNKPVSSAASVPPSAISRNPSSTAPSPFVPLVQLPIATSITPPNLPKTCKTTTPIGHTEPRQKKREDCIRTEPDERFQIPRYKNLNQLAMRNELKSRGLYCYGPNAVLVKRLETDDRFQALPRTAEKYDTMEVKKIYNVCASRSIPSAGAVSVLRERLKVHDRRKIGKEATAPGLTSFTTPSAHLPAQGVEASRQMVEEKLLVQISKDELVLAANEIEETTETVTFAEPMKPVDLDSTSNSYRAWACEECRWRRVCNVSTIYIHLADSCYSVVVYITQTKLLNSWYPSYRKPWYLYHLKSVLG